jgi:hypothetical protein
MPKRGGYGRKSILIGHVGRVCALSAALALGATAAAAQMIELKLSHFVSPTPACPCRHLRYIVHKQAQRIEVMRSTTFTVRVDAAAKKRLERLAKSTGRSRSFETAGPSRLCRHRA